MAAAAGSDNYKREVIAEFRSNGGRVGGQWAGRTLLLLHHVGAKSAIPRVTPLGYLPRPDGSFVVVACNGGSPRHPGWYHNLKANPAAVVEVGSHTFDVVATEVDQGAPRRPRVGGCRYRSATRRLPVKGHAEDSAAETHAQALRYRRPDNGDRIYSSASGNARAEIPQNRRPSNVR